MEGQAPDMSRPISREAVRLIRETCAAEILHADLCAMSIAVCLYRKSVTGMIPAVVCVLGNVPFIIIQMYRRPKPVSLRRKL